MTDPLSQEVMPHGAESGSGPSERRAEQTLITPAPRAAGIRGIRRQLGTAYDPILISHEEYEEIRQWLKPLDLKLVALPEDEQEEFIKECRKEAVRRWPWWFPNVHVHIS